MTSVLSLQIQFNSNEYKYKMNLKITSVLSSSIARLLAPLRPITYSQRMLIQPTPHSDGDEL